MDYIFYLFYMLANYWHSFFCNVSIKTVHACRYMLRYVTWAFILYIDAKTFVMPFIHMYIFHLNMSAWEKMHSSPTSWFMLLFFCLFFTAALFTDFSIDIVAKVVVQNKWEQQRQKKNEDDCISLYLTGFWVLCAV